MDLKDSLQNNVRDINIAFITVPQIMHPLKVLLTKSFYLFILWLCGHGADESIHSTAACKSIIMFMFRKKGNFKIKSFLEFILSAVIMLCNNLNGQQTINSI